MRRKERRVEQMWRSAKWRKEANRERERDRECKRRKKGRAVWPERMRENGESVSERERERKGKREIHGIN